jgi:hypothetical protein
MTTNAQAALVAIVITTLLVGCSSSRSESPGVMPPLDETVQIEVTNNNWSDMTVYVWHGSTRRRLGIVTTGNTGRFRLPVRLVMMYGLRLEADPIGGSRSYRSQSIQVHGGERVVVSIENRLVLSSLWVRD